MIVEQIIQKATQKAQSAQVSLNTRETSEVSFENDYLKSAESSQRTNIQLTVILDGKVGVSTTTDPNDVNGLVSKALAVAQFGNPAHYTLPAEQPTASVKTYDPELLLLSKPEMIHIGQSMLDMIKSYNPEIVTSSGVAKTVQTNQFANSAGAAYADEHTDFSVGAFGQLTRGTDILFAMESAGHKHRQLDFEDIANQTIEYFRLAERSAVVQSGDMPVIFTPDGLNALLLSLSIALDGKHVLLGSSPLASKLDQSITDSRFNLVDNPLIDYAPQTSAFDDEGIPRKVTPLVENGVLRNFIYDLDTAGRAGAQPTGHGANRRFTNLIISPGDVALKDMIKGVRKGLLVHEYLGLGQGNPINGEFSVNLALGYKIENGEIVGRVKDVMLAGNAYQALNQITAISQEQQWRGGPYSLFSGLFPYIQVDKLSVVAK